MKCPNCGEEIGEGKSKCLRCGYEVKDLIVAAADSDNDGGKEREDIDEPIDIDPSKVHVS